MTDDTGLRGLLAKATRRGTWERRDDAPWALATKEGYPVAHCGTLPGHPDPNPMLAEDIARLIALCPDAVALLCDIYEKYAHQFSEEEWDRFRVLGERAR